MAGMSLVRRFFRRLWNAYMGFQDHEGSLSASGIAYCVALSFFPLLLVLIAGLGWVLEQTEVGQEAQQELLAAISQQVSPDLAQQVGRMLKLVKERAPTGGPIGFAVLLISAIAIFSQLDAAFDRVWRLPHDPHETWLHWGWRLVFVRIKALGMLLGVGGFVLAVTIASMVVSGVEKSLGPRFPHGPWLQWSSRLAINLALNWVAFTAIYKIMPRARVRWVDAARGGLLTALLWEVGRQALAGYLLQLNYPSAYGVVGSFMAVMLWAYYASLVIVFGGEYVREIREEANNAQQRELHLEQK
jgi:membrane protein